MTPSPEPLTDPRREELAEIPRAPPADSTRAVAAMVLLANAGALSFSVAPFIVTGLTDYAHLPPGEAGACVSAEMAGTGFGGAAAYLLLKRCDHRLLAFIALATVAGGNLLSVWADGLPGYASTRFVAGLGCGLSLLAYSLLGMTARPEQNFALNNYVNLIAGAVVVFGVPWLFGLAGVNGLFLLLAATALAVMPTTRLLPPHAVLVANEVTSFAATSSRPAHFPRVVAGLMTLVYFSALGPFWAYVAEFAAARGHDPTVTAHLLSVGLLAAGLAGTLSATRLQSRRRTSIIACCCAGAACTAGILLQSTSELIYGAALVGFVYLWFLAFPFQMGLLSALDRSGRLTVLGMLLQTAGFVIGPLLVAPLVDAQRYGQVAAMCIAGFMIAFGCALVVRRITRY